MAVGGAIEAAGTIGNTAVKAVKDMLVGVVEGVKEIASAALPKPRTSSPAVTKAPASKPVVAKKAATTRKKK